MSDKVKLIIEIPKYYLEHPQDYICLAECVRRGTVLSEGHGRLIILSEDAIKREQTPLGFSCQYWISDVGLSNAIVAIIEADSAEGSDKK